MDWPTAKAELEHWQVSLCNPALATALRLAIKLADETATNKPPEPACVG